jgi:hypothetical protein
MKLETTLDLLRYNLFLLFLKRKEALFCLGVIFVNGGLIVGSMELRILVDSLIERLGVLVETWHLVPVLVASRDYSTSADSFHARFFLIV